MRRIRRRQVGEQRRRWWHAWWQGRRPTRRLVTVTLVLALIAAAVVVGPSLWVSRSAEGRIHPAGEVAPAPVALILGAGLTDAGEPSPFLAARLDLGQELLTDGTVQALLVSGDNRTPDHDEPTAMRDYLIERGVPAERIALDYGGRDTYDSCVRAHDVFGADRVILVSQTYHLPRAVAVCRAVGVDAQGVGDESVREGFRTTYDAGQAREWLANIKAAVDVVTARDPGIGGPREHTLDLALVGQAPLIDPPAPGTAPLVPDAAGEQGTSG